MSLYPCDICGTERCRSLDCEEKKKQLRQEAYEREAPARALRERQHARAVALEKATRRRERAERVVCEAVVNSGEDFERLPLEIRAAAVRLLAAGADERKAKRAKR